VITFGHEEERCLHPQSADPIRTSSANRSFTEKGLNNQTISEIVGLPKSYASTLWKKYERRCLDAFKPGRRGRRFGTQRELTAEQEVGIQKVLVWTKRRTR